MPLARDLLHPTFREEKRKCKLKRLVPSPNSFFMDVRCSGKSSLDLVAGSFFLDDQCAHLPVRRATLTVAILIVIASTIHVVAWR
ncbi:40S ribosomal protein S27 [Schistosoma japonicum]|nr:40S ribosomal protein S27 [Schistosoma japonicum]